MLWDSCLEVALGLSELAALVSGGLIGFVNPPVYPLFIVGWLDDPRPGRSA